MRYASSTQCIGVVPGSCVTVARDREPSRICLGYMATSPQPNVSTSRSASTHGDGVVPGSSRSPSLRMGAQAHARQSGPPCPIPGISAQPLGDGHRGGSLELADVGTGGDQPMSAQTAARPDSLVRPLVVSVRSTDPRAAPKVASGGPDSDRWVVAGAPLTPLSRFNPRPRQTSRNPAPRGRISPVFWALRCKVVGGWGGSAHYPDPTAQSAEAAEQPPPTRARHAGGAAGPPQPASASPNLPKSSTFLLFSVVVESWRSRRFERGRGATIAARCAPRPVGAPLRPAVPKS